MTGHARTLGLLKMFLVVGLAGLACACDSSPQVTDEDVAVVDEVELKQLRDDEPGLILVDVRSEKRYGLGHIRGAINIPLPKLKPTDPRLADAKHVVVYGEGYQNALSHAAAKKLLAGGRVLVSDFRGGYQLWRDSGGEVLSGDNP